MIQFDFSEHCCGCTSCANICPSQAIAMQPDSEGFLMPVVDRLKCIDCGRCDKACPFMNKGKQILAHTVRDFDRSNASIYYSKEKARQNSASGGFVYDVFMKTISEGGLACGCIWDENLKAVHVVSESEETVRKMQSSKYVQSDLKNCYAEIRVALIANRKVLFCGTPCQTAGLQQFLGKLGDGNLTSICLLCHGVPSPEVWERYKKNIESMHQGAMIDVNMRDKHRKGYKTSYVRYTMDKDSGIRNVYMATYLEDPYIFLFTDDLYLRKCCYHCSYKGLNNQADIVVGDFHASIPEAGRWGCSSVISLTSKGDCLINQLEGINLKTDIHAVGSANSVLWTSAATNPKRSEFFDRMKQQKNSDMSLFTDFLPVRFQIKKYLNQLGLFNIIKKIVR